MQFCKLGQYLYLQLVQSTGMESLLWPQLQNVHFSPFKCHSCGLLQIPVGWIHSCRNQQYFTVPHLFLQESGHSSGIPVESTGIPVESCRNPLIPVEFQWNPQESTGIPLEFHWNKTGIQQAKVEILYFTLHILPIYRTTSLFFPCYFYIYFKSVSPFLQSVYSRTLPSKFNLEQDFV